MKQKWKKKSSFKSGNSQVSDKLVQENRSELNLVPRMESLRRYHRPDSALDLLPPPLPPGQLLGLPLRRQSPYGKPHQEDCADCSELDLSGLLAFTKASGLFG